MTANVASQASSRMRILLLQHTRQHQMCSALEEQSYQHILKIFLYCSGCRGFVVCELSKHNQICMRPSEKNHPFIGEGLEFKKTRIPKQISEKELSDPNGKVLGFQFYLGLKMQFPIWVCTKHSNECTSTDHNFKGHFLGTSLTLNQQQY